MSKAAKRGLNYIERKPFRRRKTCVIRTKFWDCWQSQKAKMKSAGSCIRQDVTGKFFYFKSLNL